MLRLYTDKSFLTEENRGVVFPLLFDLHYVKSIILLEYFELIDSVNASDIIVFPIDYSAFFKSGKAFHKLSQEARDTNKPIWLYTAGDFGFTVHIPNSYTFRFGGFHSQLSESTFMLPSFINDPYETFLKQPLSELHKENKPNIGFVGYANSGVYNYIKSYLRYLKLKCKFMIKSSYFDLQPFYPSGNNRTKFLNKLKLSKVIKTNFIFRSKYRAGVSNEDDRVKTTKAFYNNIYENMYTFCIRGVGNFSVRFYEALAVGRIPILLDTDCRLPLNHLIDWKEHILILDSSKKGSLETQIMNFHTAKSNEEMIAIQKSNRLLWETHLRRHSYFVKVHDMFINKEANA